MLSGAAGEKDIDYDQNSEGSAIMSHSGIKRCVKFKDTSLQVVRKKKKCCYNLKVCKMPLWFNPFPHNDAF